MDADIAAKNITNYNFINFSILAELIISEKKQFKVNKLKISIFNVLDMLNVSLIFLINLHKYF